MAKDRATEVLALSHHDEESPFMTSDETAGYLRIPTETLRYWGWKGDGPRSVRVGRRRLYRRSDVEAWIAQLEGGRAGAQQDTAADRGHGDSDRGAAHLKTGAARPAHQSSA
jgi:excisionase family DNA binding protein